MTTVRNHRPVIASTPTAAPAQVTQPEAAAPVETPKAGWTSQGPVARPAVQERAPLNSSQVVADAQAIHDAFHGGMAAGLGTNEDKLCSPRAHPSTSPR